MKIIAELCQNHNGNFENVEKMVSEASANGATHVKIQTIYSKNLSFRPEFENGLELDGETKCIKRPYKLEFERLKSLELTSNESRRFVEICKENNVVPMTTCFTRDTLQEIIDCGFKAIKIASYDCASYQMIREVSKHCNDIFISTGATFDEEIEQTANILSDIDFTFLHCVTMYPTPLEEMHLNRMLWLKKYTQNIGLSDHSLVEQDDVWAVKAAIFLGARCIERHFTILDRDQSKDGPVSITPKLLREISRFSKLTKVDMEKELDENYPSWKKMLGEEKRKLSKSELLNRAYYRGRFASIRNGYGPENMIYNWDETSV